VENVENFEKNSGKRYFTKSQPVEKMCKNLSGFPLSIWN